MNARRRKKAIAKFSGGRPLTWRERRGVAQVISRGFIRLVRRITLTATALNEAFRRLAVGMGQFVAAVEAARKAHPEAWEEEHDANPNSVS